MVKEVELHRLSVEVMNQILFSVALSIKSFCKQLT